MIARYRTAVDYWRDQATQESGGGLWALSEAVGDALDLSGHGNDGTVTYAEGQRAVEPSLYDRGLPGMRFEEGTTNLIALNPSAEAIGTVWTANTTGVTVARSTDWAASGDASFKVTNVSAAVPSHEANHNSERFTVTPGTAYTAQAVVNPGNAAGKQFKVRIRWRVDASGGEVSVTEGTLTTLNGVTRLTVTGTCPVGATAAFVTVWIQASVNGDEWYFDAAQCEAKSRATSYCDGSLGTGYSWASTAHASASTRVATSVNLGSGDELDDIFDGGGAVGVVFNMTGRPAESAFSRLLDKNQWVLYVDGDNRAIYFNRTFSGGLAQWRSQLGAVTFGVNYALVVGYDDTDAGNDPAMYLANLDTGAITQLTITEAAAPSGTASTDASSTLYVGNSANGNRTWYGVQALPRVWQGTQPTEGQIARFFRLALESEEIEVGPARVLLYDGSFRRLGQLTTAASINRSYRMESHGQASITIAVDDPLIDETSSL